MQKQQEDDQLGNRKLEVARILKKKTQTFEVGERLALHRRTNFERER